MPGGSGVFPGLWFNNKAAAGFNPGVNDGVFLDSDFNIGINAGSAGRAYLLNNGTEIGDFLTALSGGYKMQTGGSSAVVVTAGTEVQVTVTFPIAFTTIPSVGIGLTVPSLDSTGYINVYVKSANTTSITFGINSYIAQTVNFNWIAVGN